MAAYAMIDMSNVVEFTIVADADFVSTLPSSWIAVKIGDDSVGQFSCAPGWVWNGGESFSPPPGEPDEA